MNFETLRYEAERLALSEKSLAELLQKIVLSQKNFAHALAAALSYGCSYEQSTLNGAILEAVESDALISDAALCDLDAVFEKDPAANDYLSPFLFFKGYKSLELYRVAHWFWMQGRHHTALYIQSRVSALYGVDIHPAALIGRRVMLDHATGIVVGETAVIEDNVSILHGVTLGGTGKETGKRHPTVRRGSLLGANSTILGNIEVGEGAVIGAGSVVLESIPPHSVAAGVPASVKGKTPEGRLKDEPSEVMNQIFTQM